VLWLEGIYFQLLIESLKSTTPPSVFSISVIAEVDIRAISSNANSKFCQTPKTRRSMNAPHHRWMAMIRFLNHDATHSRRVLRNGWMVRIGRKSKPEDDTAWCRSTNKMHQNNENNGKFLKFIIKMELKRNNVPPTPTGRSSSYCCQGRPIDARRWQRIKAEKDKTT